jgi:hypothetical protein
MKARQKTLRGEHLQDAERKGCAADAAAGKTKGRLLLMIRGLLVGLAVRRGSPDRLEFLCHHLLCRQRFGLILLRVNHPWLGGRGGMSHCAFLLLRRKHAPSRLEKASSLKHL